MKRALLIALLPFLAFGQERMRELMVGDDGRLNSTNAVATQADLAKVVASNQVAVAEQNAAREGFDQAVALLGAVATNVAAGTPIVFYSVELSSFDAAVVFDEANDKVLITDYEDLHESGTVDGTAVSKWRIRFAFTANLQSVKPLVGYAQVLDGTARADWEYVADGLVSDPVLDPGTYTDGDGNQYSYLYHVDCWVPTANSGFNYIRVPNDAVVADGATIDLPNGVQGGATTTVTWGGKTLTFRGGLLTGVSP